MDIISICNGFDVIDHNIPSCEDIHEKHLQRTKYSFLWGSLDYEWFVAGDIMMFLVKLLDVWILTMVREK